MESLQPTSSPFPSDNTYTYAGYGLVLLAFVLPFFFNALGNGAAQAGYDVARTSGSLLFLMFFNWLICRNRSERAKAKGRFVVGLLLIAVVSNALVTTIRVATQNRDFVASAMAMHEDQAVAFGAMAKKFEAVDLTKIMTPEAFSNSERIAKSRVAVSNYRSLLVERKDLLLTSTKKSNDYMATAPYETMRQTAVEASKASTARMIKRYADLDVVQFDYLKKIDDVLNWCDAKLKQRNLAVVDGKFQFATDADRNEFAALLGNLTTSETTMNTVMQRETVGFAKDAESAQDDIQAARKFIGK